MMAGKVTSAEVALRAGVSRSAVSRVFTPGASVSAKTAQKVRTAASDLGYRPNVLARSLMTGRSRIIGLVVAYLDNLFYPTALELLSNALQAQGYHVMVFMASQTAGNIDDVLAEILDYQVDGLVVASVAMSSELTSRCRASGVPVVLFNRGQDDARQASVTTDNYAGGHAVANYLVATGHHRIGHVAGWAGASTARDREAGFADGLAAAGQEIFAREVGDFHDERARSAARAMFTPAERPDAVFVANDHMAFLVMDVLRSELGLSVPGDVSVVGFDDVPTAAWGAYDLTTVRQPLARMVDETTRMLLAQIESPDTAPRHVLLPAELVIRGSSRARGQ
ncbi:MAG: LacI family DNA-binding transcriptional regulator [Rhodobacter sp.]|nr:LacI family DNA-binding transcriptional regulator [Rhodobacter sp.]